jgi:hypothetical protein
LDDSTETFGWFDPAVTEQAGSITAVSITMEDRKLRRAKEEGRDGCRID